MEQIVKISEDVTSFYALLLLALAVTTCDTNKYYQIGDLFNTYSEKSGKDALR